VYTPANNAVDLYRDTLSEIEALFICYSTLGHVIIAGDFNPKLHQEYENTCGNVINTKYAHFSRSIHNYGLVSVQSMFNIPVNYTFTPTQNTLDYFLVDYTFSKYIQYFHIVPEWEILSSDHLPLLVTCKLEYLCHNVVRQNKQIIAWDKWTQHVLNVNCNKVRDNIQSDHTKQCPDSLNGALMSALPTAADVLPKRKVNQHTKPYWCNELKMAHAEARRTRRVWVSSGRPRGHLHNSYTNYKTAKTFFRKLQRQMIQTFENAQFDKLHQAADTDSRLFWSMLRKRSGKQFHSCIYIIVNETSYDTDSCVDGFAEYFAGVFKHHTTDDTTYLKKPVLPYC